MSASFTSDQGVNEFVCRTQATKIGVARTDGTSEVDILHIAIFGDKDNYTTCSESSTTNPTTVDNFNANVGESPPPAFVFSAFTT